MIKQNTLAFFGLILFFSSCSLHSQTVEIENLGIYMLDVSAAQTHITQDNQENFFEKVNRLEMSLQMKKELPEALTKKEQVQQYKNFLKEDVIAFSAADRAFIAEVFTKIYRDTKMSGLTMPDSVLLIKVNGRHYGDSVYYTRENCIIIPANVLVSKDKDSFSDVMLHELAHIYSRYNPEKRKSLYELIGFSKVDKLQIPMALQNRMIYNPDGLELNWITSLKVAGGSINVCPLLISRLNPSFKAGLFANFQFALFEVRMDNNGVAQVICDEQGNPTISMRDLIPGYYGSIGTNTDYIIHPDEVIADNFMLVLKGAKQNLRGQEFSGQNLDLYNNIKSILLD